jgi:hypothetical protein
MSTTLQTYLIPLQNTPQSFTITLANVDYILTCRWNDAPDAGWVLDIEDAISAVVLASNIPLICGADLLSGLEYLGINGTLIVYTDGDQNEVPTLDNLGVESNLYFKTTVNNG